MRFLKLFLSCKLSFLCILLAFAASGNALTFKPEDAILTTSETKISDVYKVFDDTYDTVVKNEEIYSSEKGSVGEKGLQELLDSYETNFNADSTQITYNYVLGGPYIDGAQYLVVIGGDFPKQYVGTGGYLFDLVEASWDGMEEIFLTGFWPEDGYFITFVGIHGGEPVSSSPVPEPATMLLLGTGLIGLAGVGRRKFFKG